MIEAIEIDKSLSEEEIYKSLLPQVESLVDLNEPLISNLANFTSALKSAFDKISWVGFYLLKEEMLFLGPFQGKVACTRIQLGKGVCGASALNKESIIVEDVHNFPGHIACDAGSRSEIVIPLIKDDTVIGVLDLDSYRLAAFTQTDKKYLEIMCRRLTSVLQFDLERLL